MKLNPNKKTKEIHRAKTLLLIERPGRLCPVKAWLCSAHAPTHMLCMHARPREERRWARKRLGQSVDSCQVSTKHASWHEELFVLEHKRTTLLAESFSRPGMLVACANFLTNLHAMHTQLGKHAARSGAVPAEPLAWQQAPRLCNCACVYA